MVNRLWPICVALMSAATPAAAAQANETADLSVELASGTPLERQGRDQLQRLVRGYALHPWLFTRRIRIESGVIPHSHPVLTLNTRYLDNDTAQVATLLHEQLHWLLVERSVATDSAMADLRRIYPVVPDAAPEGARDEESTYLHLLVCMLEFDAVRRVFDEAAARRTLGGWRHYTWVYREVLERPEPIRRILRARVLTVPGEGRS